MKNIASNIGQESSFFFFFLIVLNHVFKIQFGF